MDITNVNNRKKQELRSRFRAERSLRDLNETWVHIIDSSEFINSNTVASYISYGHEPQTSDLNSAILKSGRRLLVPRTLQDLNLEWVEWDGEVSSLEKRGKIFEPNGAPESGESIDIVIEPTLHANPEGHRLGQGGGSYDRALVGMSAWRIGLIYTGELTVEPFPIESHDAKLNALATPDLIVRFAQ